MIKVRIEFRRRFNPLQFIRNFRRLFDFFSRFSSFSRTEPIIRLKVMSGKILIEWKHNLCRDVAKTRYMDPDIARSSHMDIANIFFNPEQDDSDEISSEHNSGGKCLYTCDVPWRQPCHKPEAKGKISKLNFHNQFRSHPGAGSDCLFSHLPKPHRNPIPKNLFEKFNCIISSTTWCAGVWHCQPPGVHKRLNKRKDEAK